MEGWVPTLISTVCSVGMMAIAYFTLRNGSRKDLSDGVQEMATIKTDIQYIRMSVDDIKTENRMTRADVKALETRVTRVEASSSSAHKRLDDHINRGVDAFRGKED